MSLICFDFEGTLVDPVRAMEHCATLTYHEFDLDPPTTGEVARAVDGGCEALFASHPTFQNPARRAAALESYWFHFADTGIVKHRLYEGVPLLLARLKRQGHRIYLVTDLPTRYARQILHQFDLLLTFDEVFGNNLAAPWKSKGELLAGLAQQGVLAPGGYLVGDRPGDLTAARNHGLRPLGVSYGLGQADELRAASAERVFDSVSGMDDWFKGELPEAEVHDAFTRSE